MQKQLLSGLTLAASSLLSLASAQYATQVVEWNQGVGAAGPEAMILGGPVGGGLGGGSFDVVTLGLSGSITLGFDVTIVDGPGVDFSIFENGFVFDFNGVGNFSEVCFVEVSTNGTDFARFPSSYVGAVGPLGGFAPIPVGTFAGMTGGAPVIANVMSGIGDPFSPAQSGGESFDLAALANDAAVTGGLVDLNNVNFVRIIDIEDGLSTDTFGTTIWDSDAGGSADIDAVAVIQHSGTVNANQPEVDFFIDNAGFLNLSMTDPDGLLDLDFSMFEASLLTGLDLIDVTRVRLGNLLPNVSPITNGINLRSQVPADMTGLQGNLSITLRDFAGNYTADQIVLQRN